MTTYTICCVEFEQIFTDPQIAGGAKGREVESRSTGLRLDIGRTMGNLIQWGSVSELCCLSHLMSILILCAHEPHPAVSRPGDAAQRNCFGQRTKRNSFV